MRGILIGFALGIACLQQQAVLPGALIFVGASAPARACLRARGLCSAVSCGIADCGCIHCRLRLRRLARRDAIARHLAHCVRGTQHRADRLRARTANQGEDARVSCSKSNRMKPVAEFSSGRATVVAGRGCIKTRSCRRTTAPTLGRPTLDPGRAIKTSARQCNFRGRDAEAALLARNIRATGYVRRRRGAATACRCARFALTSIAGARGCARG